MKVSVVIPAHNEEGWIEKTLEALLAQDHPDIEIIVVDNASTDRTYAISKGFRGVTVLTEERRGGQYARERGRRQASGEIIANLDADCIPKPDWVRKGAAYFSDPRIIAVTGPYDYYDGNRVSRVSGTVSMRYIGNALHKIFSVVFRRGLFITGGNLFVRASALETIGGYDTSIRFHGDDTDTGKRLARLGAVIFKNDIAVGSSTRRFQAVGWAVMWRYFINYAWVVAFGAPFKNEVDDAENNRTHARGHGHPPESAR